MKLGEVNYFNYSNKPKCVFVENKELPLICIDFWFKAGSAFEDSDKNGDMEIIFTGLRSGEKMSEELYLDDKLHSTEHEKINLSIESEINSSVVIHLLNNIKKSCDDNDHERIKKLLSSDIIKYH